MPLTFRRSFGFGVPRLTQARQTVRCNCIQACHEMFDTLAPARHSVGLRFLYGALDSHPFFPPHVASGQRFLTAAAASGPLWCRRRVSGAQQSSHRWSFYGFCRPRPSTSGSSTTCLAVFPRVRGPVASPPGGLANPGRPPHQNSSSNRKRGRCVWWTPPLAVPTRTPGLFVGFLYLQKKKQKKGGRTLEQTTVRPPPSSPSPLMSLVLRECLVAALVS